MSRQPRSARDRILDVAGPLFHREGSRAVGVDRVIAEAGVAKATFYAHFPSKDDLIVAWLLRAEEAVAAILPPEDAPDALSAYAFLMIDLAGRPGCLGCAYQGGAAEFGDPSHPVRAAARGVKERVLAALRRRAGAQGLPDAAAERVFLLLEGVWAAVRVLGPDAPLDAAHDALRRLLA